MGLHQICKVSSFFCSLLLILLSTLSFLHCLFFCVPTLTYKRSTGEAVPCKIWEVNQDGTMSIEYLRNGMSLAPPPEQRNMAPLAAAPPPPSEVNGDMPQRSQQAGREVRRGTDSGERGTERKGGEGEKEETPPGEGEEGETQKKESGRDTVRERERSPQSKRPKRERETRRARVRD